MIFLDPSNFEHNIPPSLLIMYGAAFFVVVLDLTWTFPPYTTWDLEYSWSNDDITYSPWIFEKAIPSDPNSYNFLTGDITKFYKFRYRVRSRIDVSPYSDIVTAGRPVILIPPGGESQTTTIAGYAFGKYV